MSYEEFDAYMKDFKNRGLYYYFKKGFRSPGWQTSDGVFAWLRDNGWWISCQDYDLDRLPRELPALVNYNGVFKVCYNDTISDDIKVSHHHVWDVGWNGVYEQEEYILDLIKDETDFKFISEVINEKTQVISG